MLEYEPVLGRRRRERSGSRSASIAHCSWKWSTACSMVRMMKKPKTMTNCATG